MDIIFFNSSALLCLQALAPIDQMRLGRSGGYELDCAGLFLSWTDRQRSLNETYEHMPSTV